jgi:hypothetical protein
VGKTNPTGGNYAQGFAKPIISKLGAKGEMKQYYLKKYDAKLYLILELFVNNFPCKDACIRLE